MTWPSKIPLRSGATLLLAGVTTWISSQEALAPASRNAALVVPGLATKHGLSPARIGEVLFDELRCRSCHADRGPTPPIAGPDLREVATRVRHDFLKEYLSEPHRAQPGSKMPDLFGSLPKSERDEIAEALSHWLVWFAESRGRQEASELDPAGRTEVGSVELPGPIAANLTKSDVTTGGRLFHRVGCVACHAPRSAPSTGGEKPDRNRAAVSLDHVSVKYDLESLSAFLFEPARARPAGRMPDMALSRKEAHAIAGYLLANESAAREPATHERIRVRPALVREGARHFERLNCHACHAGMIESEPRLAKARTALDPMRGCLDPKDRSTPRFALDRHQLEALRTALRTPASATTPQQRIDHTLVAMNCFACHERDDRGGVDASINPYFETSAHSLGDEARIPPPLTHVGAKLQPAWMRKVLYDGARARPTMDTRMPQFGEGSLQDLPEWFAAADAEAIEAFPLVEFEAKARNEARDAGRELVGSSVAACISCHDFNGKPASPGFRGTDLILTTERLQPSWFARFLIHPQAFRPRMVMPTFWLDGEAVQTTILDGDTAAQLSAIWLYLSEGRTARDPEGVRPVRTDLDVRDTIRTYRGRSRVAGFRGIAVGYPGGLNYAFDAHNGAFAALWKGSFVSARWDGQGAGDFQPRARSISFERDFPFSERLPQDAPWPKRPQTTEEQPIDPDPTYPRRLGYRFEGYHFDATQNPILRYRFGATRIEEGCTVNSTPERSILRRSLQFENERARCMHFLLLTGDFEIESPTSFRQGKLRLRLVEPVPIELREFDRQRRELLLVLDLPEGSSRLRMDYEWLP